MMFFTNCHFSATLQGERVSNNNSKFKLRASALAVVMATLPVLSQAAGLGKLTVLSGLGQPLRAEIEVSATKEELTSLGARIASPSVFRTAGIDYASTLTTVRASLDTNAAGRSVIRLSSSRPINDPFLDVLLEVNWAQGRLVREFTFLLDPPEEVAPRQQAVAPVVPRGVVDRNPTPRERAGTQPAANSAGDNGSDEAGPAAKPPKAAKRPKAAAKSKPVSEEEGAPSSSGQTRAVKRGDTLAAIAKEVQPEGVSLEQMLVALVRDNPDAFDNGNMHRLRTGKILKIPDQQEAASISQGEAHRQVLAQAADFNAYRRKLAGAVAAAPTPVDDTVQQSASGKISAKVQDKVPQPTESKDRLRVSKGELPGGKGSATPGAANSKANLEEELVAKDKALADVKDRLSKLEKTNQDLQKLIELKNQNLAEIQKQSGTKPASGAAPSLPALPSLPGLGTKPTTPAATSGTAQTTPAATPVTPAPAGKAAEPKAAEAKPAEIKPAEPKAADTKSAQPAPTTAPATVAGTSPATPAPGAPGAATPPAAPPAATPADVAKATPPAADGAAKPVPPKPAAPKPVVKPAPPPPEPSFVDEMLDNPVTLIGGGGILALLLGYGGYKLRQKKKDRESASMAPLTTTAMTAGPSVFGPTGRTVDTNASPSALHTDFSQSGLSAIDADEGVDPVAEADVYMAYGRDVQAEEILLDALKTDPNRLAIRVKLLEIYLQRRDPLKFEMTAGELYAQCGGAGAEWEKAAALGRKLDPNNPLYARGPVEDQHGGKEGGESPSMLPHGPADGLKDTWTMPGEISQLTALGPDTLSPPTVTPVDLPPPPRPAEPVADHSLDFDLGDSLDATTPVAASAPVKLTQSEPVGVPDLEFDFSGADFGDVPVTPPAAVTPVMPAPTAAKPVMDSLDDFGDLTTTDTSGLPPHQPSEWAATQVMPVMDLMLGEPPADLPGNVEVVDLEKTEIGTSLLDFELGATIPPNTVKAPQPLQAAPLNLSDISFDLGDGDPDATVQLSKAPTPEITPLPSLPSLNSEPLVDLDSLGTSTEPHFEAPIDDEFDQGNLDEAATKLELAQAYEEMGDRDGARELLNEVMAEGNAQQIETAKAALARLG